MIYLPNRSAVMPLRAIEAFPIWGWAFYVGFCITFKEGSMVQREIDDRSYTCPDCGARLSKERDLLRCESHGAFFAYGPQLLVRAPRENGAHHSALMPWENHNGMNGQ